MSFSEVSERGLGINKCIDWVTCAFMNVQRTFLQIRIVIFKPTPNGSLLLASMRVIINLMAPIKTANVVGSLTTCSS